MAPDFYFWTLRGSNSRLQRDTIPLIRKAVNRIFGHYGGGVDRARGGRWLPVEALAEEPELPLSSLGRWSRSDES